MRDPCGSEAGGAPQHGPQSGCSADSGSHRTRGWEEHAGGGVGGWRHQQGLKVWELGPRGRALCMSGADPRSGYPPGGGPSRQSARPCWVGTVGRECRAPGQPGCRATPRPAQGSPPFPLSGRRDSPREPGAPGQWPPRGPQRARHQGQPPRAPPQPSPCPQAGRREPATYTHTHTSRRRGQAKHAPGGPRAHGAAADRTCSKAAGRWAGRPASTGQGQAVEAAGQGERRFTLGEPFNPSECLPPHLKDGGNTACPRGSL